MFLSMFLDRNYRYCETFNKMKGEEMENEYKAERANVPTKFTLEKLKLAYMWLKADDIFRTKICLIAARDRTIDQRVVDDIKSVYDLLDQPEIAMARIAEILTCGGRIYDEYSEFLRDSNA